MGIRNPYALGERKADGRARSGLNGYYQIRSG
jgi:hypothetical protein